MRGANRSMITRLRNIETSVAMIAGAKIFHTHKITSSVAFSIANVIVFIINIY